MQNNQNHKYTNTNTRYCWQPLGSIYTRDADLVTDVTYAKQSKQALA